MCFLIHVLLAVFFNDTTTTEFYTLSLHDALPILFLGTPAPNLDFPSFNFQVPVKLSAAKHTATATRHIARVRDRKSTRLNSSHQIISYAVFCLKKKKTEQLVDRGLDQCITWLRRA